MAATESEVPVCSCIEDSLHDVGGGRGTRKQ